MTERIIISSETSDQRTESSIATMSLDQIITELGTNDQAMQHTDEQIKSHQRELDRLRSQKEKLTKRRTELAHTAALVLDGETLF